MRHEPSAAIQGFRSQPQRRAVHSTAVVLLVLSLPVAAETLTIATTEYTSDWNPISYQSYPAQLVTHVTTQRLVERSCTGGKKQKPEYDAACQLNLSYDVNSGSIRVRLDDEICADLALSDVAFTLSEIRQQPRNDFFSFDLTIDGSRLTIGRPARPAEWVAYGAFSFPILRTPATNPERFFEKEISIGDEESFNQVTSGPYKIEAITEQTILLTPRRTPRDGDGNIDRIKIDYYWLFRNLQATLQGANPPEIVLSWPLSKALKGEAYRPSKPENLGSFTYVGFQFDSKEEAQNDLIQSREFRELFTKSLWVLSPIVDKIDFGGRGGAAHGIFLGESFDTGNPAAINRSSRTRIEGAIADFVEDQNLDRTLEFIVLQAPSFDKLFDRVDRANIQDELNDLWSTEDGAGLRFTLIEPAAGSAEFERARRDRNYHLIFDTFIYGRNHLRYMAFVQPGNALNFLGIDIPSLSEARIDELMRAGVKGINEFLDLVRKEFPVSVIGHFPRRDLFYQSIEKPADLCEEGAVAMPYYGVHHWKKRPAETP